MTCWLPVAEAALAQVEGGMIVEALSGLVALFFAQSRHNRRHPRLSPLSCFRHASVTSAMMALRVGMEATPLAHTRAQPTHLTASGAGERGVWPGTPGPPGWSQP